MADNHSSATNSTLSKLTTSTFPISTTSTLPISTTSTLPQPTTSTLPLPSSQKAACGGADLNPNFPKFWLLLDGNHSASDVLFRMRDQACQGLCKDIQGVPGNLIQAKKQGETGCEYAVKIAAKKELYFYTSWTGKNCYDATEIIINQCAATKDAGWINGPNVGEFYQVGVRG